MKISKYLVTSDIIRCVRGIESENSIVRCFLCSLDIGSALVEALWMSLVVEPELPRFLSRGAWRLPLEVKLEEFSFLRLDLIEI